MKTSTGIQAGELAALFGILLKASAALRPLTQRRHTHLRLAVMTRAAQTRVVPLRGEVVALIYYIVFYIYTCLPCVESNQKWRNINETADYRHIWKQTEWAHTPLAEERELLVAVLSVPAVQAVFIHALALEALQLGAEDVVLRGRGLPKLLQALRRPNHLHGPCEETTHPYCPVQITEQRLFNSSSFITFGSHFPTALQGVTSIGDHILIAHPKPGHDILHYYMLSPRTYFWVHELTHFHH